LECGNAGFDPKETIGVTIYCIARATTQSKGLSHFVTSMTAPVASGWSGCRVGTRTHWKAPPCHGAHPNRALGRIHWFASFREF
jgi:hypothetical protein